MAVYQWPFVVSNSCRPRLDESNLWRLRTKPPRGVSSAMSERATRFCFGHCFGTTPVEIGRRLLTANLGISSVRFELGRFCARAIQSMTQRHETGSAQVQRALLQGHVGSRAHGVYWRCPAFPAISSRSSARPKLQSFVPALPRGQNRLRIASPAQRKTLERIHAKLSGNLRPQ